MMQLLGLIVAWLCYSAFMGVNGEPKVAGLILIGCLLLSVVLVWDDQSQKRQNNKVGE